MGKLNNGEKSILPKKRKKKKPQTQLIQNPASNKTEPDDVQAEEVTVNARPLVRHEKIEEIKAGPIPDPQTLAEYRKVIPNLPETIIDSWKDERKHRQKQETKIVDGALKIDRYSQLYSFIISLLVILLLAYGFYKEQYLESILLGLIPISMAGGGGGISKFIKKSQKAERQEEL